MAENAGKLVVIKVSGAAVVMTAEATTNIDDQVYQITNTVKQVIDWATPPTVLVAAVITTESYTVNYLNGKITFATVDVGRGAVTVTGKYLPMSIAAYANSFSRNRAAVLLEAAKFGLTHMGRVAGLKSASGALTEIDVTDELFLDALTADAPVVIEDRAYSAGDPNRVLAMLENVEDVAEVAGLQSRTIGWASKNDYVVLGG